MYDDTFWEAHAHGESRTANDDLLSQKLRIPSLNTYQDTT
jgi:hypothetical protein